MSLNTILATAPLTTTNYILKANGTTIGNSLIWDNGTNVGIGNQGTTYTLDVSGTGYFSGIVGIGVAPSAWYNLNGYVALQIGNASLFGRNSANSELYLSSNVYDNSSGDATYITTDFASRYIQNDGTHTWLTAPSGTAGAAVTLTPRMTILQGGNVGIGTSSPTRLLHLNATTPILQFTNPTTGVTQDDGLLIYQSGLNSVIENQEAGYLGFLTTAVERMRITSGGQVGIGDYSSAIKLLVKSDGTSSAAFGIKINDSSNANLFFARNDGNINMGTAAVSPYNYSTSGRSLVSNSAGDIGYTSSTRESKSNIESITDISWVNQLRPVSFNYRIKDSLKNEFTDETYDDKSYGFIADEVEKVNPDFVFYDIKEDGTKKLAGVKYESMTAILTKAIQEQNQTIQELSNRLIKLESK